MTKYETDELDVCELIVTAGWSSDLCQRHTSVRNTRME